MAKLALPLLTAAALYLCAACTPSLTRINLNGIPEKITMDKGACLGNCPVFKLTIYENGIAAYLGERNTDRTGLYYKKLEKKEWEQLLAGFRETNLWQFNDIYRGDFMDQQSQTVSITFFDQGSSKKVMGKSSRPEAVRALERRLDAIVRADGWVARDNGRQEDASEMIVQLRQGVDAKSWIKKYRENKLEILDSYGSREDFWLVKFDARVTPEEQLLRKIRRDEEVVGIEIRR
jgi:hypothetical protein